MSGGRIDLWWLRLGEGEIAEEGLLGLLDYSERSRLREIESAAAARFFAFRRAARRVILAQYLEEQPERVAIAHGPDGKPRLASPSADLYFGASHSQTSGVIAVSREMPVGVDLEIIRPIDTARFAERILSPSERLDYQGVAEADRAELILRAWTAKEALGKGMGIGLDLGVFRRISVPLTQGRGGWQPAHIGGGLEGKGDWMVCVRALAGHPGPALVSIAAPAALPVNVIDASAVLADGFLDSGCPK